MKRITKIFTLLFTLMFLAVATLLLVGSCGERNLPLRIENRTDITLTIYVQEHEAGTVEPNRIVSIEGIPGTLTHYLIEAKNGKGEVIYSKKFSASELHDEKWKVIILPSQK
jgi:hypothetical protein